MKGDDLTEIFERVRSWPKDEQERAIDILLALEAGDPDADTRLDEERKGNNILILASVRCEAVALREELPRVRLRLRREEQVRAVGSSTMTVCVASMFFWLHDPNSTPPDVSPAFITASDRMMTAEQSGMEYEPATGKWALLTPKTLILVADDITVHSELLQQTRIHLKNLVAPTVALIADFYAERLRELKAKRAGQYVLSLYGLTPDTFVQRQREMDPNLTVQYAQQMEDYQARIRAQALILGMDADNTGHIYHVTNNGIVNCYDDVGFASIGIGSEHANSQFRLRSYSARTTYYPALLLTYLAKKSAEIAPGVGKDTDMFLVTRDGITKITDDRLAALQRLYTAYIKKRSKMEEKIVRDYTH